MKKRTILLSGALAAALFWGTGLARAAATGPVPTGINYDLPNFANSPLPTVNPDGTVTGGLRKFIDSLPGLGPSGANNLQQFIPTGIPDVTTYSTNDYYEIGLVEYRERMHSDLPAAGTKIRGYVQLVPSTWSWTDTSVTPNVTYNAVPLDTAHGLTQNILLNGVQAYGAFKPHYLGPVIIAQAGRATRIKFTNLLPLGAAGKLFVPVDTTLMGAGVGPDGVSMYAENRATLHLHGGFTPWISDGTPHQWVTPAGEPTPYTKGLATQPVPDMPLPSGGSMTFYYPNQQSGRLMFYHDHALGVTRLNVYAGEAAGYLLVDPAERALNTTAGVVAEVPLIIQDKSFVWGAPNANPALPGTGTYATDPTWATAVPGSVPGDMWWPHIYMANQDPFNPNNTGANPLGRWDYGPWFWPPQLGTVQPMPASSCVPETFVDTPLVNGTAYPYANVPAGKIRLRILNACNDRMLNLQFYQAAPLAIGVTAGGSGYTNPIVTITDAGGTGAGATATATAVNGVVTEITVTSPGTAFYTTPVVTITDALNPAAAGAMAIAKVNTEVAMVPALPNPAIAFPPLWLTQTPGMIPDVLDGRPGGIPDPAYRGPAIIQIGTEGGLLPAPALIPNTPVGYEQNKRNIIVLNVAEKTLFMGPAERADIIIDLTPYAGKTIILYNDSPAPVPAPDPRYDYYTGNGDYSITGGANYQGGAPTTLPGYGPNTRTIMQLRVAGAPVLTNGPLDYYDPAVLTALQAALPQAYTNTQEAPVIPQVDYPPTYASPTGSNTYVRIQDNFVTFTPAGGTSPMTLPLKPKCIQELFDPFGRMNSLLGVELPLTSMIIQTTIPFEYIDPVTETLAPGETQVWKITHNGVDTHAIHFHLVNVQLINRVGWDGSIRPPDANELGWKETVRMHPLEDCIVAMRAAVPPAPFTVPNSIRPLDVTRPLGTTAQFSGVDPNGNPVTVTNKMTDFGWEYVWHCHLLGHEENDMMRPLVLNVAATAPTAPLSLTAVVAGPPLAVNLTWAPPALTTQTGYQVQRATVTGGVQGPWAPVGPVLGIGSTTYSDTSVAPATTYAYRVVASNAAGPSAPSNVVTVTTPQRPAAASNLTAMLAPGTRYVMLNWTINGTLATGFTITRTGGGGTATFTVAGSVASFVDTSVNAGFTYTYTVTAFDAAGNAAGGPPSASVTTPAVPGAPTSLATATVTATSAVLTWSAGSPGTQLGFYVWRSSNNGATWSLVGQTAGGSTLYPNTGLTTKTTYLFRVQAWNAFGLSGFSNTRSVTTL